MRSDSFDGKLDSNNWRQRVQRQVYTEVSPKTEVSSLNDLEPGQYLVVPCTGQPGIQIKFLLRIFTDVEFSSGYDLEVCMGMGNSILMVFPLQFVFSQEPCSVSIRA